MKWHHVGIMLSVVGLSACKGSDSSSGEEVVPPPHEEIVVRWNAPTHRMSGEELPIEELAGYEVHIGLTPSTMLKVADIPDPTITSYNFSELEELPPGEYQVGIIAVDIENYYSQLSTLTTVVIPVDCC